MGVGRRPEWIIWFIWAIVGQYTDKMTQKCVKNVSFCPCSDTLWLKWVKWFTRGFHWGYFYLFLELLNCAFSHRNIEVSIHFYCVEWLLNLFCQLFFFFLLSPTGEQSTNGHYVSIIVAMGFFIFEQGWFFIYPGSSIAIHWLHHLSAILFLSTPLYYGDSGAECCVSICFAEVTLPIIMIRWFLRDAGCPPVYLLVLEYIFLILMVYFRIVLLTLAAFEYTMHPNARVVIKVNVFILWAVSLKIIFGRAKSVIRGTISLWNGSANSIYNCSAFT